MAVVSEEVETQIPPKVLNIGSNILVLATEFSSEVEKQIEKPSIHLLGFFSVLIYQRP